MPIVGLSLEATREYRSKFDPQRETPEATVFVIGTLDSRILGKIRDRVTSMNIDPTKPDEVLQTVNLREMDFDTVVYGLRSVRNFTDETGKEIPFLTTTRIHTGTSYVVADPSFVRRIPEDVVRELAGVIRGDNTLTQDQAGNSVA